jgi:hypothetical protein
VGIKETKRQQGHKMTRWIIQLNSESAEDDSKVMKVLLAAGKSGLKYTVRSEELKLPKTGAERLVVDNKAMSEAEPKIVK